LILRKNVEIVATRCHFLELECTKFPFGWGSTQTPLGSLQRSPDALAGFKGRTSKGKKGRGGEGAMEGRKRPKGWERKGEKKGKERGKGRGRPGPTFSLVHTTPLLGRPFRQRCGSL